MQGSEQKVQAAALAENASINDLETEQVDQMNQKLAASMGRRSSSLEIASPSANLEHGSPISAGNEEQKGEPTIIDATQIVLQHHPKSNNPQIGATQFGAALIEQDSPTLQHQLTSSDEANCFLPSSEHAQDSETANQQNLTPQNQSDNARAQFSATSKIKIGVCCMQKKLLSRPMKAILASLTENPEIEICRFNDNMLLNLPIEQWLRCDVLIAFYSTGFPLQKAIEYVQLRKPIQINALEVQHELWDRTKVIEKLRKIGVPVAKSYIVYRDNYGPQHQFTQAEIEAQAIGTKDKGEFYIREAQALSNNEPIHRREEKKTKKSPAIKTVVTQTRQASNGYDSPIGSDKSLNSEQQSEQGSLSHSSSMVSNNQSQPQNLSGAKKKKKIKSEVLFEDQIADVQEYDDCIVIRGEVLKKPFIEKPINAEDHEIMIHYSNSSPCGSGYSVLFRKTESACSQFISTNHKSTIRHQGSYLYEEFLPTDGFDIKVYTVGEDYAHAEARRCPSIDGKVQRDESTGKEVRYPVNLNSEEKEMARRICREFKQDICGFDMLRCGGKTYVCDVNGFSFVKTSFKYYQDCAMQLRRIVHRKLNLNESLFNNSGQNSSQRSQEQARPFRPQQQQPQAINKQKKWELRSVVAVFRHGDRTPKQKMKMTTKDPQFLKFFKGTKDVKIKKPKEMQEILQITVDKIKRILQLEDSQDVDGERDFLEKLVQLKYVLEKDKFEGFNRKIQMKCIQCEEVPDQFDVETGKPVMRVKEALFICKFGGELTHAGCNQADAFGRVFRESMYVEDEKDSRGGLLRLHSTYRHDLKVYTSDEGRCQKTAASFLKGLLQIEGALAPILAIMVINDKQTKRMLDDSTPAQEVLDQIKVKLQKLMHYDGDDLADEFRRRFEESPPELLEEIFDQIGHPIQAMQEVADLVSAVIEQLQEKLIENGSEAQTLESYRHLPNSFDKIFHANRYQNDPNSAGIPRNLSFGNSSNSLSQFSRNKSQSPSDNLKKRQVRSHSADNNEETKNAQPQIQRLGDENSEGFFQEEEKEPAEENKSPANITSDQQTFNEAKKVFLRRIEGKTANSGLPYRESKRRQTQQPSNNSVDQVIKELQQEEDEVSSTGRGKEDGGGISVNQRLKSSEITHDGQPYLIQLKRWKKIQNDYVKKDGTFDISKIPEICDNIKFDNLHNPEMMNEMRLDLLEKSQQLCRIIVPMEYGVTKNEQIDVGLKIITPLLKKIRHDILWWKQDLAQNPSQQTREYGEERQWEKSGLDSNGLDDSVRSTWRHIRTRLYFTSASHMYTLLHTLKLGVDSILIDENDVETKNQLDGILRLDFMSGFVFRLFEDLNVNVGDPGRFKLEIMVNRGATVDRTIIQNVQNNTVPILHENFVNINKKLTIDQLETFFQHLLTMQNDPTVTMQNKSSQSSNMVKVKKNKTNCVVTPANAEGNGPNNEDVKEAEESAATAMTSEGAVVAEGAAEEEVKAPEEEVKAAEESKDAE